MENTIIEQLKEIRDLLKMIQQEKYLKSKTYLTAKQAALYTGFSYKYMLLLAEKGEITYYKKGIRVFFKKEDLDIWLSQHKTYGFKELQRIPVQVPVTDLMIRKTRSKRIGCFERT